jgi:3-oxoacyl-[acyl-carrier protein] reductase
MERFANMKTIFLTVLFLLFHPSINVFAHNPNNTIMVTASTGDLGEAICTSLASEGYDLIITGRNQKKLDDLQKKLKSQYKKIVIQTIIVDFSDIKTIEHAAHKIPNSPIKGIVLIGPRPILSKTDIPLPEEWSKAFSETFIAPLEVIRLFAPRIHNNGSIVIISGNSSKSYLPDYPNTNVLRLTWTGEIKNLVHSFGERKIRVNVISPGPILTKHHEEKIKEKAISNNITFEEQLSKEVTSIPLKSYGKKDDLSHLVWFLLSDKSAHLNGMNILLDGGASTAY